MQFIPMATFPLVDLTKDGIFNSLSLLVYYQGGTPLSQPTKLTAHGMTWHGHSLDTHM